MRFCRWLAFVVGLVLVGRAERAWGWAERRVESSATVIELERDGSAIVRHELWLEVRGAPLQEFSLEGIDADAVPLPDASVTRMKGSVATSLPLPVQVTAASGRLDVSVPLRRGFRGRTFLLKVAYRTELAARGLIRPVEGGQRAELSWVGPRFSDGVDSVTLTLRAGAAARAPELATTAGGDNRDANFGIVMSTLRRSRERDELELVRAHVARDEAITWRVWLDGAMLPAAMLPAARARDASLLPAPEPAAAAQTSVAAPRRWSHYPVGTYLPLLVMAGVAYGLLVRLKTWRLARAAVLRRCEPRALVGWPASWRSALAGACLSGAAALVLWADAPLLAAVALISALVFAAELPPASNVFERGGGKWQTLDATALDSVPSPSLPGAWLDAGRVQGFVLLCGCLAGSAWGAAQLFETSPYLGACALLGSTIWLPIFCTGRAAQLPVDALAQSRRFLRRAQRCLARDSNLVITPIGRVGHAAGELDELRLSISPARGLPGLIGVELGVSFHTRFGGFSADPVIVVRAADGSPCQRALPLGLSWTRGRTNDERATLARPKLPTVTQAVTLVHELLAAMQPGAPAASAPSRKQASKSSGKGLSTAKAGTRSSPAHAT